jgi:hypothetical protein
MPGIVGEQRTKMVECPIQVPTAVLEGLERVWASGETNMRDHIMVQAIAARMGYLETALWIENHPHEYAEGISLGFVFGQ